MNRNELIDAMANGAGITKTQADSALKTAIEAITGALKAGHAVTLVGFGTFEARNRAGRPGRNPKTGELIVIPASIVPAFKPGKGLRDALK